MTQDRVAQAEREADAARASLEQSLDELRARLAPGRMIDETLAYVRRGSAGQFVKNFGRQVRSNPLPVGLVGAGLAWLMLARRNSSDRYASDLETRYRTADDSFREFDLEAASTASSFGRKTSDAAARVGDAVSSAKEGISGAYDSAADAATAATEGLRRGMHDARDRASDLGQRASDLGQKVKGGVTTLMEEHPLLLGALGTQRSAQRLQAPSRRPALKTGSREKTSDNLKQQAKDTLSEQADKAMNVAERAYEGAYDEGKRAAADAGWVASGSASSSGKSKEKSGESKDTRAQTQSPPRAVRERQKPRSCDRGFHSAEGRCRVFARRAKKLIAYRPRHA